MGIEYSYQALPAGAPLLARALADPYFAELLEFRRYWWDVPPQRSSDLPAHEFVQEARALLAAQLRSTQGFPLRYTPPDEVGLVWLFLEPYTRDTLLEQFDPERIERDTYKGYGYRDDPDLVWSFFEELRRLYREAYEHNEGVLVVAS